MYSRGMAIKAIHRRHIVLHTCCEGRKACLRGNRQETLREEPF